MRYTTKELEAFKTAYIDAYKAANKHKPDFTLAYIKGWFLMQYKEPTYDKKVRVKSLKRMTEVLRKRANLYPIYPEIKLKDY